MQVYIDHFLEIAKIPWLLITNHLNFFFQCIIYWFILSVIGSYAQRIRNEEGWKWWQMPEQNFNGDHRWHKNAWDIYEDPLPKGYTASTQKNS